MLVYVYQIRWLVKEKPEQLGWLEETHAAELEYSDIETVPLFKNHIVDMREALKDCPHRPDSAEWTRMIDRNPHPVGPILISEPRPMRKVRGELVHPHVQTNHGKKIEDNRPFRTDIWFVMTMRSLRHYEHL